jgi:hypothetical protein
MARLLARVGDSPRTRIGLVLMLWLVAVLMGVGAAEWVAGDLP